MQKNETGAVNERPWCRNWYNWYMASGFMVVWLVFLISSLTAPENSAIYPLSSVESALSKRKLSLGRGGSYV